MKIFFTAALILFVFKGFAQSTAEAGVLKLSNQIFKWEVANKIDDIDNVFAEQFVVVNARGESQTKSQYMAVLKSGNFVHNAIDIEENTVTVVNNTATVFGRGKFMVTASGNKIELHLSYMEVFARPDSNSPWKVIAMHASKL